MRPATLSSLSTVAVMAASVVALVCISMPASEPPGRIVDDESTTDVVGTPSTFAASGGLIPDAVSLAASSETPRQARASAAQWTRLTTD